MVLLVLPRASTVMLVSIYLLLVSGSIHTSCNIFVLLLLYVANKTAL